MKKISKKLLLSVFSLLLMATVLGTSTYAWFTIGDTVTVSKFDMDVQGGLGLEVAYVYQDPITVEGTEISREGFVTRLTAERIYEYLSKDYEYDSPENFNEEFKMGDVTSVDGNEFLYLKYNEADNVGSYSLKTADRVDNGFVEFTLRFRTKEADAFLIWEDALLESQGVADWVPGFKFNAPNTDNTLIDPEGNEYTQYNYYASHAARISVTGTVEESKTAVYELAAKDLGTEGEGEKPDYLNTVLSDNEPDWEHGNLQYFHTSTDYDLKDDFGTGEETYYKAAKTFTSFVEDEDEDEEVENGPKVVAKFVKNTAEEDDDVYYYADVTIRVYIEGFDAEAFDSILEDKLSVMLRFTFEKSSVVNGDGAD